MEVTPIKPITSTSAVFAVSSEGHKLEKNADLSHLIVTRRQGPTSPEDTPRDALDKAEQDRESVEDAAEKLNKLMGLIDKKIQFAVHEKTQRIMVKILQSDSGKVVSEFPSERILDLYASLIEAIGIAVDEKI